MLSIHTGELTIVNVVTGILPLLSEKWFYITSENIVKHKRYYLILAVERNINQWHKGSRGCNDSWTK